jgi:cysteine desulfurase
MRVYLDHNATSPLRPEARAVMIAALDAPGNALSVHADGRHARATIEAARGQVAHAVGAAADDIVFTSGGSESNALALRGAIQGAAAAGERITRLIISAVEHDSVRATADFCEETVPGLRVVVCPVTRAGVVDTSEFVRLLSEGRGRALVSLMSANNETGAVQPLAEVAKLARASKALVHSDAVQAVGKVSVNFSALGVDYLSFNAHKFGGPQGVGALAVRQGAPLASQIRGGGQEFGRRAGTENVAAIACFGAAVEAAQRVPLNAGWRANLERKLQGAVPQAVVFGEEVERLPNTICIAAPGVPAENMVIALDLDGISVSAGAACSSGKVTQSHVLAAMGVEPRLASCAIRMSFGWNTSEQDLALFADAWIKIVKRAEARAAA